MSLTNATLLDGATIGTTGGTAVTFAPSGKVVVEGVEIIDVGNADIRTRTTIAARSRMSSYNPATSIWSKGKRYVSIVMPKVLASGAMSFPVIRIEMEDHPEQTAAERLKMRSFAAQVLIDSDFDSFFVTGSRS